MKRELIGAAEDIQVSIRTHDTVLPLPHPLLTGEHGVIFY